MEREGNNLNHMLTLFLVFFLLISVLSLPMGVSYQSSVGDSNEIPNQVDVSFENTLPDLEDSNPRENTTYEISAGQQVDIMILYTSNAQQWASSNEGSIHSVINEAVDMTNTVMDNSNIDLTLNTVHTSQVDYTETGDDLRTDISRLRNQHDGYMEEIHDWRDYYGADLVSLFVERDEDAEALGVAIGPSSESQLTSNNAYSVVSVEYATRDDIYVFTHEIGHNFGAGHYKGQENYPGPQLYDYSAGWRWITGTWPLRRRYRTVMAYDTLDYGLFDYELVPVFSNPNVKHEDNNEPVGCPEDGDNARTIRETKEIISNYQEPTPQIDINYPSTGAELYQGSEQEIQWETISGDNSVSHIDLYYSLDNGTSWETIEEGVLDTGSYSWEVPLEVSSSAIIYAEATDEAGFSRNDVIQFEIKEDDIPPEIELLEPMEDEIFKEQELMIRWEGEDNQSGISHYEVTSDAHDWEDWLVTESTQYTFSYLENGEHLLGVRAVDNAGNENITTVNVTIDTIDPFLEIKDPIDGGELEPGDITVVWEGYDDLTGISYFEIRLDDNRWIDVGEDTSYTFGDLEEGNYTITVWVVDRAGNTVIETIEFEVKEDTIFEMTVDFVLGYWWILISILLAILLVIILLEKEEKERRSQDPASNQVQSDFIECGGCGAVIPSDVSSCPECEVEFSDEVECINCGELVDIDLERCPECGLDFFER